MNVSQASINLDVSDLPSAPCYTATEGMIITNNERWEIACSGSEPGGFSEHWRFPGRPGGRRQAGDILQHRPPAGHRLQLSDGEQDGINFDPCSRPGPSAPVFSGQRAFSGGKIKNRPSISGGLPITAVHRRRANIAFNDYLSDIYLGGVQAMRFSVSGLCIQVKSPTCKITDDSKTLTSSSDGITKRRIYRAQQHHRPGSF